MVTTLETTLTTVAEFLEDELKNTKPLENCSDQLLEHIVFILNIILTERQEAYLTWVGRKCDCKKQN